MFFFLKKIFSANISFQRQRLPLTKKNVVQQLQIENFPIFGGQFLTE